MDAGLTEKFAPLALVPIAAPPEETVYQLIVLPADVAFKLLLPPTQIAAGEAVTLVGAAHGEDTILGVILIKPLPCLEPCVWMTLVAVPVV